MAVYSVDSQSIVAVADEIRGKTGLTDALSLEQMMIDAASLPGRLSDVPVYVQSEAERVAAAVKALQNENTLSFIAMSDVHVGSDAQSRASALHAAQGAKIISKLVPIDFSAILGDVVTGANGETSEQHIANHMASLRASSVFAPELRLSGNHDANIYEQNAYQSAADVYRYTGRFTRAVKPASEIERNYFYLDIEDKKTRAICLNTADLDGMPSVGSNGNEGNSDGHNISAAQFAWLVSALDMTEKTGWRVIVLSHHPLHWYGSMPNVQTILEAYVGGKSGSITVAGGYGSGDPSATVSYNFSGKNAAKLVATFHGHTHNLIHGKVGQYEIIRMGTPNACFGRNNEYGSYGGEFSEKYGESTSYVKTANSAKDTAFCVYTIDFDSEAVFATCYGAGYDRTLSYSAVSKHFITYSLSNITSSNTETIVESGNPYATTLTVNDGYTLKSVSVVMGGVDITADVYSNGVISIPAVTGDVTITAVTNNPVVNLVSTSVALDSNGVFNGIGYQDGVYVSSSGVGMSTDAACTSTGLITYPIPAVGVTAPLYISGVDFLTGNDHERIRLHKVTDKTRAAFYGNIANQSQYWTVTQLGDKYYKIVPTEASDGSNASQLWWSNGLRDGDYYIQFTFVGKGANLVISWDEIA